MVLRLLGSESPRLLFFSFKKFFLAMAHGIIVP